MNVANATTSGVESPRLSPRLSRARAARRGRWIALGFLAPNLIGVTVFTLIPLIGGLLVAFTQWNVVSGLGGIKWIGLGNFEQLLGDLGTVGVGGVEERDAELDRATEHEDRLAVVAGRTPHALPGELHGAVAEADDGEVAADVEGPGRAGGEVGGGVRGHAPVVPLDPKG